MGTGSQTESRAEPPARLHLRVTAAAQARVRAGHPWLFADSIQSQNREARTGELAVIYDRNNTFLAVGLADPGSPIAVRILHAGKSQPIDGAWWARRLNQALGRRRGVFDDQTNGYRWINGESDGWPGLVLDRYAETLVLKLYTAAWLSRLDELVSLFRGALKPQRLVLRLSRNIQDAARAQFQREDGQALYGEAPSGPVVFRETGLQFEADVLRGQKTGFFLDQRENRRAVERLAMNRDVLNAFSFSGAFSLYAARGGARSVTNLDISAHALNSARANLALNQAEPRVAACAHRFVQADAFEWLACEKGDLFGLVILDPPSLAKRESERTGAVRAYEKLALVGIRRLEPGGVLVACSCSAHVSAEEFFSAVRKATGQSRRQFQVLQTTGHAPDHPATFAEADYLKAIYLRLIS